MSGTDMDTIEEIKIYITDISVDYIPEFSFAPLTTQEAVKWIKE